MKNKGFSLVELIIVIAIMAILAAAIAPALIRYIDKSRRSDDVAAAETINTSAQAALANEDAYDEIQTSMPTSGAASDATVIAKATAGSAFTGVVTCPSFLEELNSSQAGASPKLKYTKDGAKGWTVGINGAGKPVVWLATTAGNTTWELQPTIDKKYK